MKPIEELLQTTPIKDPYQRALINIMYTGGFLQNRINQILKPFGLTEPQYNVLRILRGQKGVSMNLYEIQDRMIKKDSNVSRLVDKLVEKKWVTRKENNANRRRVDIHITGEGLEILERTENVMQQHVRDAFAELSFDEATMLGNLLDRVRD